MEELDKLIQSNPDEENTAENDKKPWPIKVNTETRLLIKKAALAENKTLENFFKTSIRQLCEQIINESDARITLTNKIDLSSYVTKEELDQIKREIIDQLQKEKEHSFWSLFTKFSSLLRSKVN